MVTMYFLAIFGYAQEVLTIPHKLPLFPTIEECRTVAKQLNEVSKWSRITCLPIQVPEAK